MSNRKTISKYILLLSATVIATIIFIFIYESISYIKYKGNIKIEKHSKENNNIELSLNYKHNSQNNLNKHRAYLECMETHDIMIVNCNKINNIKTILKNKEKKIISKYNSYKLFNDLLKSNIVIKIIYLFLILALAQQLYLFLLSKFNYLLNIFDFHRSEWAINVAPMFGLLGTFFSMATLLNGNSENIDTVLIKNFFNAVMTTIIGIIFYIINFYLKISIYPKINIDNKND